MKKIVLIGASTGGPGQIQKIISSIKTLDNTSVIIAQHMVSGFIESFASRLQDQSELKINLVQDNQALEVSNIYICEAKTELDVKSNNLFFTKSDITQSSFNPNINILFNSFTPLCKKAEILCVILTGIGDDGVDACRNLSLNGAKTMTESSQSAIVDGMPHKARELVPNIEVYDIDKIIQKISEFCE